jgi:phosphatidylinositol-bisphosphatase
MEHCSIRAGTFNVNGKLPFQDLSTWLDAVPPPSDTQSDKRRHSTPLSGEPSLGGTSVPPLKGQNDKVSHTMSEPDLLVVALQEVDQSAEALFYTTSPAREDAWIAAILAALGEKAEKYEKVPDLPPGCRSDRSIAHYGHPSLHPSNS